MALGFAHGLDDLKAQEVEELLGSLSSGEVRRPRRMGYSRFVSTEGVEHEIMSRNRSMALIVRRNATSM
jgi:hypothetical protein